MTTDKLYEAAKEYLDELRAEAKRKNAQGTVSWQWLFPKLIILLAITIPAYAIGFVGKTLSFISTCMFIAVLWIAAKMPE